ncbi:MAG: DNA-binding protein WhiA [Lachnospiraceae bacterium]|nr:DNA-binding protein WhiA [Lachnospiraceae bacterium]
MREAQVIFQQFLTASEIERRKGGTGMSFSGDIKNEIARQLPDEYHCLLAEIAAVIRYAGTLSGDAGQGRIMVETENVTLAKKYLRLIKKAFEIPVDLNIKNYPSGKSHLYRIVLSSEDEKTPVPHASPADADRSRAASPEDEKTPVPYTGQTADPERQPAMGDAGREEFFSNIDAGDRFSRVWMETADWVRPGFRECLLEYPCCRRAFIRGAFLTAGSMSNPGKSYHFEIVCRDRRGAEELCRVIETFEIRPKIIERKHKYVVYLKDSESIVDILNVMSAANALMRLENIRIIKDMKNSANRQYNCDSANINKMVLTATRQLEDIRLIERNLGLDRLTPALREMAVVRLEHPEESLKELGVYLDPPVGKSGVNHRLKKLGEIAEALRQEDA